MLRCGGNVSEHWQSRNRDNGALLVGVSGHKACGAKPRRARCLVAICDVDESVPGASSAAGRSHARHGAGSIFGLGYGHAFVSCDVAASSRCVAAATVATGMIEKT